MTDCKQLDCNNKLISLIRNKYFYGKLLTVDDFNTEQNYFIEKDRIINRLIHGAGIVCGLGVTLSNASDKLVINIEPGVALDGCGNLIIVNSITCKEIVKPVNERYYIYLKFAKCYTNPQPAIKNNNPCQEECCYGSVREVFEIIIENNPQPKDQKTNIKIDGQIEKSCYEYLSSYQEVINTNNSKVLIAVIKMIDGKYELDESFMDYRSVVYNHPMLRDLLLTHIEDFENPHNTTASQVKALQRINDIGNLDNQQEHVSNINFVSDSNNGKIDIATNQVQKTITIKIADDAVKRKHLNSDVIRNLLTSQNQTVSIAVDSTAPNDTKKINIQTTPAGSADIRSVGSVNSPGISSKFAPADHVHGLRINDITPDEDGQIFLAAGENINITKQNNNKLVISTKEDASAVPTSVAGTVILVTDINGNAMSKLIDPGIEFPYSLTIGLQQETKEKETYVDFGTPVFLYGGGRITASSRVYLSGKEKGNFVISANYSTSVLTHVLSNKRLIFHWVATPAVNINPVFIDQDRPIFEPPFKTAVPIEKYLEKLIDIDPDKLNQIDINKLNQIDQKILNKINPDILNKINPDILNKIGG